MKKQYTPPLFYMERFFVRDYLSNCTNNATTVQNQTPETIADSYFSNQPNLQTLITTENVFATDTTACTKKLSQLDTNQYNQIKQYCVNTPQSFINGYTTVSMTS